MSTMTTKVRTYKRYNILLLVFITVVINYMDRSNISVAASAITSELGLTKVQMGLIFSAFAWSYSSLQIPGGIVVDYVKPRILYPFMMILWSIVTLVQGFVGSLGALIGCRIAIGAFEAPSYPCNNKIVTSWFPEKERASAIAVYTSGQFIGLAFLTPVLILIQDALGWRGLFIVSGILGIVWALIWYLFYRDPNKHGKVSKQELEYIEKGGGLTTHITVKMEEQEFNWKDLRLAFTYRKLWGVYLGQFCLGSLFIFFLTWFPTYLVEYRGLDFIKSGFLASVPFLAAFVGVLLSGFTSDFLVRKGYSNELARKAPIIIGMFLSLAIIGANYTDNTVLIIFFLSLAFFGNGLASITWVFVSLLAPKKMIGLVGGVFNFIGGLAAALTPILIGWLAKDGDFKPALFYIGALALIGFCSYLFLVGKVKRIELVE
ncbi:glucarate transporter [Aquimarina aggregata]|uniref:Glucarate transporter n=1 Tax=Aquimarina aggregata TaxID=1642818 RepID=A0A162XYA5_9FLAO|nr:MFS transporter [Aquimarina aggregata]KZS38838.1 glucarate transporter [Aquimarina aggregata]